MAIPKLINDEEFVHALNVSEAVTVVDMFAHFAGPCEPVTTVFKKLKSEYGDQVQFLQAQTDHISYFQAWRNKSCPTFSIWICGVLVGMVKGANTPLLEQTIREQVQLNSITKERKPAIPDMDIPQIIRSGIAFTPGVTQINYSLQNSTENLREETDFTVALVKPDGMVPSLLQDLLNVFKVHRFDIVKEKRLWLTPDLVNQLYPKQIDKPFYTEMVQFLCSSPCLAFLLSKENAIASFRTIMGPFDPTLAKAEAPKSIRALHASDPIRNVVHGSSDPIQAQKDVELLFSPHLPALLPLPINTDVTMSVLVLGPELNSNQIEAIVARILTRFQITQREQRAIERIKLLEWLEDTPASMLEAKVGHWGSGPLLAMVVKGEDVLNLLNELIGPEDPELAKQCSPSCLRALYGTDLIKCGLMASSSQEKCHREHHLFFPRSLSSTSSASFSSLPLPATVPSLERTLVLIKPDVSTDDSKVQAIQTQIQALGFHCVRTKQFQMTLEQAHAFYREHIEKPFFETLTTWMSSAPIWALELEKENAVQAWRDALGPTNSELARDSAPQSLRAIYGTDATKNALHGSDSIQNAQREIELIFGFPNLDKPTVWSEPSDIPSNLPSDPLASDSKTESSLPTTSPSSSSPDAHPIDASSTPVPIDSSSTTDAPPLPPPPPETTSLTMGAPTSLPPVTEHPTDAPTHPPTSRPVSAKKPLSAGSKKSLPLSRPASATKAVTLSASKQKLASSDKLNASARVTSSANKLNTSSSSSKLGSNAKLVSKTVSKNKLGSTKSMNKKESSAV